jgi:hypothetical protein
VGVDLPPTLQFPDVAIKRARRAHPNRSRSSQISTGQSEYRMSARPFGPRPFATSTRPFAIKDRFHSWLSLIPQPSGERPHTGASLVCPARPLRSLALDAIECKRLAPGGGNGGHRPLVILSVATSLGATARSTWSLETLMSIH